MAKNSKKKCVSEEKTHSFITEINQFEFLFDEFEGVAIQGYYQDGEIFLWNRGSERIYDYSKEEAIGNNLFDLIIPDDMLEAVREGIKKGAETV